MLYMLINKGTFAVLALTGVMEFIHRADPSRPEFSLAKIKIALETMEMGQYFYIGSLTVVRVDKGIVPQLV